MKTVKAICVAMLLAAVAAVAGEIRITSLDVEADRAVSVTGAQSNQLVRAAAAAAYAYSPTNPPPAAGGDVVSVNGQTGVVVITAASLDAVEYNVTVITNEPAWILRTDGLSYGDGEALAAGTYATTIYQYLSTGVYRITGADYDQFWVTNTGGNVDIFFAPLGTGTDITPRYYTLAYEHVPNVPFTLNPSGGELPAGTATLTLETVVVVTTNYFATEKHVADVVAPKLDRSGGTATNLTVAGTLTASTVNATTSAGGALQNANGQACLTWGAGNGQGVTFANGVNVSGALSVSGAATLTNTAVTGSFTLNGEPVGQCPVWQSMGLMPNAGAIQYPTITQLGIDMAFSATNLWFVIPHPAPRSHIVIQLQAFGTTTAAATNLVSLAVTSGGGYGAMTSPGATQTTICDPATLSGLRSTNIVYIAPAPDGTTRGGAFLRFDLFRPNTLAAGNGVTFLSPFWRCATSNEIETKTFAK